MAPECSGSSPVESYVKIYIELVELECFEKQVLSYLGNCAYYSFESKKGACVCIYIYMHALYSK
jgi:hypothetical protein